MPSLDHHDNDQHYKVDVGRVAILLMAMVGINVLVTQALQNTSRQAIMIDITIVLNIVPILAIVKHGKMKKIAIAALKVPFKSCFCN